jgi:UV DNA damage endonuclease
MRLGFPVKVLGPPSLKSHDTRRWQNHPHLSVSLAYLRDIFLYLHRQDIRMYRIASDLAPYVSHPGLPQFHSQIEECSGELAAVGEMAADYDLRLSFHLQLNTVLNADDEAIADQSVRLVTALARILEGMSLGPQAVIVTHVGGIYSDKAAALERFASRYERLPAPARSRVALENDDGRFSVPDILWLHERTGVPLVFDYLHLQNHNPEGLTTVEALSTCLKTWPTGVRAKIHFSSPRTAMRFIERKDSKGGTATRLMRAPRSVQHADFVDPFQFVQFTGEAMRRGLPAFDVMLEAKAKDLALLHLRGHLERFAPDTLAYGEDGGNRRASQ